MPEPLEPQEPPLPPLTAAFTAWVTTGAVSEEVAAAGSGVEAARHEAAQARTVARVGTVRAGPGGKVQYPPPLLPLRPLGLDPSPPEAWPPHGVAAPRVFGLVRSAVYPARRPARARASGGAPLAGRGSWGYEIAS